MKFVVIFAEDDPILLAVHKIGGDQVLDKIFKKWSDFNYLWDFFEKNVSDLNKFSAEEAIESAIIKTTRESSLLRKRLLSAAQRTKDGSNGEKLDSMFQKLHERDSSEVELRASKSYGLNNPSWLRIYGIRIESDCYIITGGMIKLLNTGMQQVSDGKKEYNEIKKIQEFLDRNNLRTKKAIIKYIKS